MTLLEPAFEPRDNEKQYHNGDQNRTGDQYRIGDQYRTADYSEQRPPVYNAEDYTVYLRKHCRLTGLQLYLAADGAAAKKRGGKGKEKEESNKQNNFKESVAFTV